jgi:4-hydroxy-tetrahydrodipicolinate synthase
MTQKIFKGLFTALVTPFTDNGEIDYSALETLLAEQLKAKVDGLVILGTTGESPVITAKERATLLKFIINYVKGKTDIIVGTGSNNTADTIEKSREAESLGIDGLLVVNPYYNKPTQEGLYNHFSAIAKSVHVPIILYNIKGRTGVNLETYSLLKLAELNNIVAVKEASGDLNQAMDVIHKTSDAFSVLSGDDSLACSMILLGGNGVVSVLSNLLPAKMKQMVDSALRGETKSACEQHYEMYDLMQKMLTLGSNPMAIKTALATQGKIQEVFRSPLCPLNDKQKLQLKGFLGKINEN